MRNGLFVILLSLGFLLSGVFVVDERQVAVVKISPNKVLIYAPGIHWQLPFSAQINHVYTNLRTSYITLPLQAANKNINLENISIIVNWQVVKPAAYINFLAKNSRKELDARLVKDIITDIMPFAQKSNSVAEFENLLNSKAHDWLHDELGIKIINIALVSALPKLDESKEASLIISESSMDSLEHSYNQALGIKESADKEQQVKFDELRKKDAAFFDYFMKIRYYQLNAKSKQDVPALDKLSRN